MKGTLLCLGATWEFERAYTCCPGGNFYSSYGDVLLGIPKGAVIRWVYAQHAVIANDYKMRLFASLNRQRAMLHPAITVPLGRRLKRPT